MHIHMTDVMHILMTDVGGYELPSCVARRMGEARRTRSGDVDRRTKFGRALAIYERAECSRAIVDRNFKPAPWDEFWGAR